MLSSANANFRTRFYTDIARSMDVVMEEAYSVNGEGEAAITRVKQQAEMLLNHPHIEEMTVSFEVSRHEEITDEYQYEEIRSGTRHHEVLSIVAEHGPMGSKDVKEIMDADIDPSGALSVLTDRNLVNRNGKRPYSYAITEYGQKMISELPSYE